MKNKAHLISKTGYIAYTFEVQNELADLLASWLFRFGFEGTQSVESGLIGYIASGYDATIDESLAQLQENIAFSFSSEFIAGENWNTQWEKNFQPVTIGNRCIIRASFHPPAPGVEFEIIINPKMSFGTGHHETTAMMVEQLLKLPVKGKSVLDYGCGTGILAILAERLGAATIDAIDNDEWSFENATENAELNQCTHIRFGHNELAALSDRKYDIILANINKNVLLSNAQRLSGMVNQQGMVLLSGILENDTRELIDEYKRYQLTCLEQKVQNNWVCLLMAKLEGE